jgi:proteasome-associated ATPase
MAQYNRSLLTALDRAHEEIARLRGGAAVGTSEYGVFLGRFADGMLDVFVGGRRLRTCTAADLRADTIRRGETVLLDSSYTVIHSAGYRMTGPVLTVQAALSDGRRALVGPTEARSQVIYLSDQLISAKIREGDRILVDEAARYGIERVPGSLVDDVLRTLPKVSIGLVAGLDRQIAHLRERVEGPLRRRNPNAPPTPHVLLYGPPGCGKSLLARAFATSLTQSSGTSLELRITELLSKYVGEAEDRLRMAFRRVGQVVCEGGPVAVVVDDLDAALPNPDRTGHVAMHMLAAQLLTSLDELSRLWNVVVIGTTNRPDLLDPAAIRMDRFGVRLEIGRPGPQDAREIFQLHAGIAAEQAGPILDPIVDFLYGDGVEVRLFETNATDGRKPTPVYFRSIISGAAIATIVSRAKSAAVRQASESGAPTCLTFDHLHDAATAEVLTLRQFPQMLRPASRAVAGNTVMDAAAIGPDGPPSQALWPARPRQAAIP